MANTLREQDIIWKQHPGYSFIEVGIFGEVRTKNRTITRSDGKNNLLKGEF